MDKYPQPDMSDVIDHLSKLKGLKKEELTEEAMLRSRIDQQSDVISVLKQRSDEYLTKYINQEKELEECKAKIGELKAAVQEEKKMASLIQERFTTLDANHTEMIKLKDEYKRKNDELAKINANLIADNKALFSSELNQKENQIKDLEAKLKEAQEKEEKAMQREGLLQAEIEKKKSELDDALKQFKVKSDQERSAMEESLSVLRKDYDMAKREIDSYKERIQAVEEENIKMKLAATNAHSLVEVKETELNLLKSKFDLEVRKAKEAADRYRRDAESVSTSVQVRKLKSQLEDVQDVLEAKNKEYEAYKAHTTNLLRKEQELNAKLRRLHVPGL